jgi:beta-glucosidase
MAPESGDAGEKRLPWRQWALGFAVFLPLSLVFIYIIACIAIDTSEPNVLFEEIPEQPFAERLPEGFLWGTATSAHQVEGGNYRNDWARFEETPGNIRDGALSGVAVDHWNRVSEDIGLMLAIGANAYRFSVEWSRVEPQEGIWDESAWSHYVDEVEQLRAAGIVPMVTLLHFTIPEWVAERGGVAASDFPGQFARFAAEAARRLGSHVDLWCTINEPNVQMYQGYVEGVWPPGVRDTQQAAAAFEGLVRAHAAATRAIRDNDSDARIGAAVNMIVFDPASKWSLPDWIAAREADRGFNWAFYDSIEQGRIILELAGFPELDEPLDGLAGSADYLGINYYRRNMVNFTASAPGLVTILPGPGQLSDSGVEIYPEGLLRLLRRAWKRYALPVYITENGVADSTGAHRPAFIRSHAYAIAQALDEGIPVRGYFHWSLLDNFEWAEGFGPRFGLYRVDYQTLDRIATPAGDEFARLAPAIPAGR